MAENSRTADKVTVFESHILNSLDDSIVVVDKEGVIIKVNKSWFRFNKENGETSENKIGLGSNYLDLYRSNVKSPSTFTAQALTGIKSVLAGAAEDFMLEYPCRSSKKTRWYLLRVGSLEGPNGGAVISHSNITRHKEMEEALRESQVKNNTLLEVSPVCTKIIDLDSRLQYMSAAGQKDLKIPDAKLLYGDPYPLEFYPESTRMSLTEHLERAKAGDISSVECLVFDMEGSAVWYLTTFVPARDEVGRIEHIIGTSVNITQRKQTEEALQRKEERYRTLVESSPYCIHEIDLKGQISSMNSTGLKMMELALESEIIGRPYLTAVSDEDQERIGKQMALAFKGEPSEIEFQAVNGRYFQSQFVPLYNEDGAIIKLMGLTQDITKDKLAQEALLKLRSRVVHAQEIERRRIAQELHDDIGQRLALLVIEIQTLTQGNHDIEGAISKKAETLTQDLQTLSSDLHRISYELYPSNLEQLGLVKALKGLFRELREKTGFSIQFTQKNISTNLPPHTALCLYRITQEAIWNAAKHSRAKQASVYLSRKTDTLCLHVSDTGVGFDPTEQRERSLGILSMIERINLAGGEISIQSQPNDGTTIMVQIPVPLSSCKAVWLSCFNT